MCSHWQGWRVEQISGQQKKQIQVFAVRMSDASLGLQKASRRKQADFSNPGKRNLVKAILLGTIFVLALDNIWFGVRSTFWR